MCTKIICKVSDTEEVDFSLKFKYEEDSIS